MATGPATDMDRAQLIKALRDTAQSASNSVAGNVSGPVDFIAEGMRKARLPIPANAIGSSQWMAETGLTAPVDDGMAKILGETVGMVVPVAAAGLSPKAGSAINNKMKAYHGPAYR